MAPIYQGGPKVGRPQERGAVVRILTVLVTMRHETAGTPILLAALLLGGCAGDDDAAAAGRSDDATPAAMAAPDDASDETLAALRATLDRADRMAADIEDTLRPVPLLRPAEEQALKRYGNAANLERARRLGARVGSRTELESLVAEGRLVPLEDSTRYWIVREMRQSAAFVTPDMHALLERIGARFHDRLAEMGLPPYRMEISSALRTSSEQASLRQRNVNATAGTSAHEYGTTVDIAYSAYAPPQDLPAGLLPDDPPAGAGPLLDRVARSVLESVSARKSRELKAILGHALRELQSEGDVLVTLEQLQPVYHITVARAIAN